MSGRRGAAERNVATYAAAARAALEARDHAVRRMAAAGASLREIAEVAGMSHAAIARILKRGN